MVRSVQSTPPMGTSSAMQTEIKGCELLTSILNVLVADGLLSEKKVGRVQNAK